MYNLSKQRLKISLLTETFPPEVNGVSFTLYQLARGLSSLGSEIEVLRPKRIRKSGRVEPWDEVDLPSRPIPNYPQLRFGLPCGALLYERWQNCRPDIIYLATEGPSGFSALRVAKKLGIQVVSGYHTNFDLYLKHYRISFIKPLIDNYLKWFHNQTHLTFAPTDWMIKELKIKGYKNLKKLSRGVDHQFFSPQNRSEKLRKSWNIKELDRVMISVSRVAPEKNLDLVCKVFTKMIEQKKAKMGLIVGDGPERIKLSKKYPKILFTGCLDKNVLSVYYASADLFLFASQTETFGNVITEALSSGLPVIAYDYAAASEYIVDGNNGKLSPMGNSISLEENFESLLECSGLKFAKMSNQARLSTQKANWINIIKKLHDDLIVLSQNSPFRSLKSNSVNRRKYRTV